MDVQATVWVGVIVLFSGLCSAITYMWCTIKPSEFAGGNYVPRRWEMRDSSNNTWAIVEYNPTDRRYPFVWTAGWKDRVKTETGRSVTLESAKITIKNTLSGTRKDAPLG